MRFVHVRPMLAAALLLLSVGLAQASRPPLAEPPQFATFQSTADWINAYRITRDAKDAPKNLPLQAAAAIRAMSRHNAFKDPEASGAYVGFIAGLIATNPNRAHELIEAMLPMRAEDQWAIVRGIAYSGTPRWKFLLKKFAPRMPTWQAMIERHLEGKLATLDQLVIKPSPTTMQRMREALTFGGKDKPKKTELEPTQTVIDTLWGHYLASGSYGPLLKLVAFLPWANDKDDVEKLTLGSMAKYTLAMNAVRDQELLRKMRHLRRAREQSKEVAAQLDDIIRAAETADPMTLRKNALAAIEQLKIKGPNYKREMSTWAKIGQGAIAVGCVAAAATGHIEFGLPCVLGGGATNAAAYYLNDR